MKNFKLSAAVIALIVEVDTMTEAANVEIDKHLPEWEAAKAEFEAANKKLNEVQDKIREFQNPVLEKGIALWKVIDEEVPESKGMISELSESRDEVIVSDQPIPKTGINAIAEQIGKALREKRDELPEGVPHLKAVPSSEEETN